MRPGTATRVAAVVGHPVEHSRSPALHNAAYRARGIDAVYLAFDIPPAGLAAAVEGARAMRFLGLNVTVPHKHAAMALCDEVDADARMVGAVNTIVVQDGRLRGANTDVEGFGRSLDEKLAAPAKRAVVLGAGGAARAVVVALARRDIFCSVIARDVERARPLLSLGAYEAAPWTARALAEAMAGADVIIDATSAGLSAHGEDQVPAAVPLEDAPATSLVTSLVYHREPALLAKARARGLPVLDGAAMLVYQAARAFTLMTGAEAPLDDMWAAFRSGNRADG